ncbi:MAG TPA: branched-chain amino acid ABC transporter permease [Mycobacteriales bacterium]|nr:branched-chain amino acid ABC transporter permease [Mycobacteriales bacterium]
MDPQVALQAVLTGLAQGAVYGLVALGFTLVHRLVRVLSFAHGDLVVTAVFVGVLVTVGRTPVVTTPGVASALVQVLATLLVGTALSVGLYLLAVRPFLHRTRGASSAVAGWVAATLAVGLLLREGLGLVFTREAYAVADPLRLDRLVGRDGVVGLPGDVTVPSRVFGVVVVGALAALAVDRWVARSRTGVALRAVADDAETAALMGIPTERVVLLAFAVAGLLAGLAGLLSAPAGRATVSAGAILGLKAAAAALLGRLGSLRGAVVAGLALGVVESLAVNSTALGPAYADVLALGVLVVVLAARPEGLRSGAVAAVTAE